MLLASRRRFLVSALVPVLSPVPAAAAPAPALQLARTAAPDIHPRGYLVSEKLDGVRAFWDGTQLRFRSGLAVVAPRWFVGRLPPVPLDGELWMGRGRFEAVSGAVRKLAAVDADWRHVRYEVFDLPAAPGPFAERARTLERLVPEVGFAALAAVRQHALADAA